MIDDLVVSNLLHRKTRTILTAAGIALGVALIVLTVGVINGFLNRLGQRNSAVTAEILMRAQGMAFGLGFEATTMPTLPTRISDELRAMGDVKVAVPVVQFLNATDIVDGIEYEDFARVSEACVVAGRPIASGDEVMIDEVVQRIKKLKLDDEVQIFGRPFRVVGVYAPESLSRFKIPLATMQRSLNRPQLCSLVLIQLSEPKNLETVAARISAQFPETRLVYTRDLPVLFAEGTPPLETFRSVVVGLAIFISTLVMLLTMHTTVAERTRQIGILKSLGASKSWIAGIIEKEALLVSLIGGLLGFLVSVAGKWLIEEVSPLTVAFSTRWFLFALATGIASGALGAVYPALRAANQDAATALSSDA